MKNKILTILITILTACIIMFTLSACEQNEPPHTHDYDQQVVNDTFKASDATCEDKAKYYYSCSCGEKGTETFESGEPLGHEYGAWVSNNNGTHTKTCANDNSHKITEDCIFGSNKACKECGYITTALLGTEISSDVYSIDGTNLFVKVPNSQTSFYFGDVIDVAEGATFKVYADVKGTIEISTYMSDIVVGDNTFYITVSNSGSIPKTYTTTVRRRPKYTVTFNANGGTAVATQTIEEDFLATEPTTTRAGYTFTGWDYDFNTPITKKTTVNASWKANKDTKYIVEYYLQNLENDKYTLVLTENKTGTTDTTAEAEKKTFAHFTHKPSSTDSGNIDGKGTLVLRVYYTRDTYTVTTNVNNDKAGSITSGGTYKYDKEITLTATTNDGYTFLGWFNGETKVYANASYTFNVSETITLTAKWKTHDDTKYTVEYYLQNLEDDDYTLSEEHSYETYGLTDNTATLTQKTIEHFTFNNGHADNVLSGNIDGKGTLVLRVYYTRDTYTISTTVNNDKAGSITSGGTYKYDKEITLTATTNDGYTFLGWFNGETKVYANASYTFNVSETIMLTAKWSTNVYNIEYELNGGVNSGDNVATYTVETQTITLQNPTRDGYTFNGWYLEEDFENQVTKIELGSFGDVKVYAKWTAIIYNIEYELNGGVNSEDNVATYTVEIQTITLQNPTRNGYTFSGWFTEKTFDNQVAKIELGSFGNVKFYAKWTANVDTKYVVEYYLQNIEDDGYTLSEEHSYETKGTTDTTASVEPKDIKHFTFNNVHVDNVLGGNINGDGTLVLKVYYTRNVYTLSMNDSLAGSITNTGSYKYGSSSFDISVTTINLAYDFLGWYSENELLSTELTYMFTATQNVTAKFLLKEEMANFKFTSTTTSCKITGIKDNTVVEIIVPDYVTSISKGAFSSCSSLESIIIPFIGASKTASSGYDQVFGYIFGYTTTSSSSSVSGATYQYYSYSGSTYYHYYIPTSLKTAIITGGTSIGEEAFYNCHSLASVTIGDSVTSIGDSAFYKCSSLTSVTIGNSVESIGNCAFEDCSSLISVTIGNSVESIGNGAFEDCSSLISIVIPDSVTTIGGREFYYCSSLTSVTIGNSVTSIGSSAFYGCSSLTSVTIPNSVTSIGDRAFYGCSSLTRVDYTGTIDDWAEIEFGDYQANPLYYAKNLYINNELVTEANLTTATKISNYAFYNCTSLTSIEIPNSVTSIGDRTFYNCTSLTSIEIPNSVTSIGNYAFYNCSSLETATIPTIAIEAIPKSKLKTVIINGGESIGDRAFYNCTSLTSIEIPNSVTSIGSSAFFGCSSLTSVTIGNSVTSIGSQAFYNCSSLTSIEIAESVTSIGNYAFYNCTSLTSIVFEDTSTWYRTTSSTDWQNKTDGTEIDVTNASTNATYFKSTYYNYYWYKL